MEIKIFKTLWGFTGNYQHAIEQTIEAGMQGIEGPAPDNQKECIALRQLLNDHNLDYIADITTAGSYVPDRQATLQQHIDSFRARLANSLELNPLFITCLGGCDAWPEPQSVEFFSRAMELASEAGVTVSFETHRGRSLFNPWVTQRIVEQIPDILLTCDFSH